MLHSEGALDVISTVTADKLALFDGLNNRFVPYPDKHADVRSMQKVGDVIDYIKKGV